jgi:sulfate-transporting ATPase
MRRGRSGRRLIAVRTNERAAAALGISVAGAKLYAFGLSAAIAALGGILLAFRSSSISFASFDNFTSIADVGYALIGGIGYLIGPVFGATLAPGAIGSQILNEIGPGIAEYIPLIGGLGIILLVLLNPDGIASDVIRVCRRVSSRVALRLRRPPAPSAALGLAEERLHRVAAKTLEVRDLTVAYGGTIAVDRVSLTVRAGEIVGLIGPNGAGKTTLIDAVTGFTRARAGRVLLEGQDITAWSPTRRARSGIARSFQSLELFEDSTVLDNLRCASDPRDLLSYVRDPLYPVAPPLAGEVASAIKEFDLDADLATPVQDLPYGERRLLAIARAVATRPSVLLLDEPAAGLGDVETAELAHLVRRLADEWGMAVLLVEHDMAFVMSVCDTLVVLDFGRTISEGIPAAVRRDPAVVAAYLGDDPDDAGARLPQAAATGGHREVTT